MMNKISTVRLFCARIDLVCLTLSCSTFSLRFLSVKKKEKKQVKVMSYRISFPVHFRHKLNFVDLENI